MTQLQETSPVPDKTITTELVAKTVASIHQIGYARRALIEAGYTATIVANRITVDGLIEAVLTESNGRGWWTVSAIDGTPPVWTVGAHCDDMANWIGCVE